MPAREFRPNEVSAGGVVVRRGSDGLEVCLVSDGRYWGLPKGNVDRHETPVQAALREIHEEVGLDPAVLRIAGEVRASEYVYKRQGRLIFKRVHVFAVEAPAGSLLHPDGREITETCWLSLDAARAQASFVDTVRAIDEATAILEGRSAAPS